MGSPAGAGPILGLIRSGARGLQRSHAARLDRKRPRAFFPSLAASAMLSKNMGWRRFTCTINFPPPGLLGGPSSFHDERIVSWVKFFNHALSDGDERVQFQTRPVEIQLAAMLAIIDDGPRQTV